MCLPEDGPDAPFRRALAVAEAAALGLGPSAAMPLPCAPISAWVTGEGHVPRQRAPRPSAAREEAADAKGQYLLEKHRYERPYSGKDP